MDAALSKYRIPGTCEAFYIPNFVTVEEECYLMRKVGIMSLTLSLGLKPS